MILGSKSEKFKNIEAGKKVDILMKMESVVNYVCPWVNKTEFQNFLSTCQFLCIVFDVKILFQANKSVEFPCL